MKKGNASYRLAKPFIFFLFIAVVACGSFSIGREAEISRNVPKPSSAVQTPIANRDDAIPVCPIDGPMGPWDRYQMRDLPHGDCSGTQVCSIWTKDSCPGTHYPGPAIKWQCVCDSGEWRCDEQERTKTACIER
jgi:hypothetical protein